MLKYTILNYKKVCLNLFLPIEQVKMYLRNLDMLTQTIG